MLVVRRSRCSGLGTMLVLLLALAWCLLLRGAVAQTTLEEDREELVLDHRHQRMDPSSYEQPLVLPAEFFSKEIVVSELERRANEPNIVAHTAWSAAGSSTAPAINASLVQDQEADHVVAAISRIFKGSWKVHDGKLQLGSLQPQEDEAEEPSVVILDDGDAKDAALDTAASASNRHKADSKPPNLLTWSFTKSGGTILIRLLARRSKERQVSFVTGDLIIRDGNYSSDLQVRYVLHGILYPHRRTLLFFGNTLRDDTVADLTPLLENNATLLHRVAMAAPGNELETLNSIAIINPIPISCYLTLELKVELVPYQYNQSTLEEQEAEAQRFRKAANDGVIVLHEPPVIFTPDVNLTGTLTSPNCHFKLDVNVQAMEMEKYFGKAVNFVLLMSFVSLFQILLVISQINSTSTPASAAKISLLCIGMQAIMDSYSCLVHLITAVLMDNVFNAFASAAFLKFIMFSVFEMRYMLLIWKARRPQAFNEGWAATRQHLSLLYARIYAMLVFGFILMYAMSNIFEVVIFILHSFWVPQIFCNASRDCRGAISKQYLIGISMCHLSLPLYFYGCPVNFISVEPSPNFVMLLIGWMAFQVCVILLQDRYGPRFFIPKQMLPPKYDYYHKIDTGGEEKDCVICMNVVEPAALDYMVTPCNHLYHQQCLVKWMEFKMECPTCRGPLPPP